MYGGFWQRLGAFVIDRVILLCALLILSLFLRALPLPTPERSFLEMWDEVFSPLTKMLLVFLALGYTWPYYAILESSGWQATVGKKLLKLMVTDLNGRRITFWRASGRFWSRQLLWLTYLGNVVSAIMIVVGPKKQALHDKIARTIVVSSERPPVEPDSVLVSPLSITSPRNT
jgi:uncharacterized RDD family membrane protein YckC